MIYNVYIIIYIYSICTYEYALGWFQIPTASLTFEYCFQAIAMGSDETPDAPVPGVRARRATCDLTAMLQLSLRQK